VTEEQDTKEIPRRVRRAIQRREIMRRRDYRDAITYTVGITLIMSQLVLQVLDSLELLSGEPSVTLITAGIALLSTPAILHRGDRKEDEKK
jgi:hypothetical protein